MLAPIGDVVVSLAPPSESIRGQAQAANTTAPGLGPRTFDPAASQDVLWPETAGSTHGTPPRRLNSVRRTTSIEMHRPDGPLGVLRLVARGRDLLTSLDGTTRQLDVAGYDAGIDFTGTRTVVDVTTDPVVPGVSALVGTSARSGFRAAVRAALPPEYRHPSLLAQLLDDVPVVTIVSGSALARAGVAGVAVSRERRHRPPMVDICAGWQAGGAMARRLASPGHPGMLQPRSPLAGGLGTEGDDDPLGWHDLADLPPTSMRRLRRIDVAPVGDQSPTAAGGAARRGEVYEVDAMFRDSYVEHGGIEVVIHEYAITVAVDAAGTVLAASASPGVLPGPECPQAAGSADRIVGLRLGELRNHVARQFVGVSTCTHLNDALRAIGDVSRLVAAI